MTRFRRHVRLITTPRPLAVNDNLPSPRTRTNARNPARGCSSCRALIDRMIRRADGAVENDMGGEGPDGGGAAGARR
jgi:hypothetical protein